MKYSKEIIQGLAFYIDLQDVKAFTESRNNLLQEKNKIFNISSWVTKISISPSSNIEYIII